MPVINALRLAHTLFGEFGEIDRADRQRSRRPAKASEMAGEEIDRVGDSLATDEERQLRKHRLIKGPQEFRDIRSNRAKIKPGFPE